MAEGPVVHKYARRLRQSIEGQKIEVEFGTRKLKPLEPTLQGIGASRVEAHGKQVRIHLGDGKVILVHLLMWGSWRIYRKGAAWDRPRDRARLILRTKTHEAVAFSAPVVKILSEDELLNAHEWGSLGPDPLRSDFSFETARRLLKGQEDREIGEVLLDQRVIAGVGNILRIEILFFSHVHPRRKVKDMSEQDMEEVLHWTSRLMHQWLREMGKAKSWRRIYRRSGHPCPVCGTTILFFRQAGRITYACPECQK